jgi:hypothetical protein
VGISSLTALEVQGLRASSGDGLLAIRVRGRAETVLRDRMCVGGGEKEKERERERL